MLLKPSRRGMHVQHHCLPFHLIQSQLPLHVPCQRQQEGGQLLLQLLSQLLCLSQQEGAAQQLLPRLLLRVKLEMVTRRT